MSPCVVSFAYGKAQSILPWRREMPKGVRTVLSLLLLKKMMQMLMTDIGKPGAVAA